MGKAHLAVSLGLRAAQSRLRTLFTTAADLVLRLETSQREERLGKYLRTLAKCWLLVVVDEIGFLPLARYQAHLLIQVAVARYERGSMMLTSNLGLRA